MCQSRNTFALEPSLAMLSYVASFLARPYIALLQLTNVGIECSSLHVVVSGKVPAEDVCTFPVR